MANSFKKDKVKVDLLTDSDILFMVDKGIYHSIYQYAKVNNKYMTDYDKSKGSSYIQYQDVNDLYGWEISENLPVNNFESIKDTSQFNEDFLKNCNEERYEGYFLEVDGQHFEKLHELYNDLRLLQERISRQVHFANNNT